MGAGVSTEGAPLTRVKCKNNLGVLFDPAAEEKFYATATGPEGEETVPWPAADAYVKTRDERWRDPKHVLFQNLKQFKVARVEIEKIADELIKGTIREIPQRGQDVGDECQQRGLDGMPAASLDPLYEIAELAREVYANVMNDVCEGGPPLNLAPLKGRARAEAKAKNEYANKTAPCYSWLFDIVRGSVYCDHEDELVALWKKIEADPRIEIVRTKNRFNPPLFNGYRDIMMNVAVDVDTPSGKISHLCELQIHLTAIKKSEPMHKSHVVYEFFRSFFLGNAEAVEQRLDMFCALPVDDAKDADELVDRVLRSDADSKLLEGLSDLLESIQEFAGVVKVREDIFARQKRAFGRESKEAGGALHHLGGAYGDLGDIAKKLEVLERVLPIYERGYGGDSAEVAGVLNDLGHAYGKLGNPAKKRDLLERALPIYEQGKDSSNVASVLGNLGNAYGTLGDYAKKRGMLERALVIFERECGKDSTEVAQVLMNLGVAYGDLGDKAKRREMLERALAIQERAHGRDHAQVAITLVHLGATYGAVGDYVRRRDMLERALAILERVYGRDHAELAITLAHLVDAYGKLGDQAKERDMLERALAMFEQSYSRDHVANTLYDLGNSYGAFGDISKGLDLLKRALANKERAYGRNHVEVAKTLYYLGCAYHQLAQEVQHRSVDQQEQHRSVDLDWAWAKADYAKAREMLERALAIQERRYGRGHPKVAKTLMHLGVMPRAFDDEAKNRKLLERALAIYEREFGTDDRRTWFAQHCLERLDDIWRGCAESDEEPKSAYGISRWLRSRSWGVCRGVMSGGKFHATQRHAHELARADASSYDEVWKTFVADETKLRAFSGLVDAYKAAMAGAEKRSKRQAAPSVSALFEKAYALQPLVIAKAEAIGGDTGVVYGSTKTVARAFQKAWRSYGGDYRRLCDVVRVSIAFETMEELTACLERIVADDELELIPQGMEKCRFDPEYAPHGRDQFVGYRDLQLSATFRSDETRRLGLDQHVIEIQLHLRVFEAIKKGQATAVVQMALLWAGTGHRTSCARRSCNADKLCDCGSASSLAWRVRLMYGR
jgi:tetratricopeptide (TPR) repeat protein